MVTISISEKRNPIPQQISIGKGATLTTWGAIKINQSHFFPSSFQLKTDDFVLYIDPVAIETTDKADFILITHAHPDHFSIKDIKQLLKKDTHIICAVTVFKKLKNITDKIQVMKPNEQLNFETLNINTVFAYNTKPVFLWLKAHPKSKQNVGYILTLKNGVRIYHAGDTDYIPEIKKLNKIEVILVPIGGERLTMDGEAAAKIVNEIQPKIAIPMHYEIHNNKELSRFKNLVNKKIKVVELGK